jgi:DNA-binding NarL/FixJ family response regulator
MLSMHDNDQYMLAAARAGASGYMLKSDADEQIVAACRALLTSDEFLAPPTAGSALRAQIDRARRAKGHSGDVLTRRELEVLKLVAEGHSSREIADELTITVKTVDRHRSNIMSKLDVTDRVQLARHAIRRGLIEP